MHVFFSGFYSSINGATGWTLNALRNFNPNIITLTDFFKKNGYNTYRYCDAKDERTVPKSGFDVWESSGFIIGKVLSSTNYTDCPNRQNFINFVKADGNKKFVYHHVELLHELNCDLGLYWSSEDYIKNIQITAKEFEKLYNEYNITDKDIVIISSDHGVLLDKQFKEAELKEGPRHEEISNICFMSITGKGIPNKTINNLIRAIDIAPTLCKLIHGKDMPCQGEDIMPDCLKDKYISKPCFREKGSYFLEPQSPEKSNIFAVRDGDWKYVFSTDFKNGEWLIDLKDGDYKINLKNKYPDKVEYYKDLIYENIIDNKVNPLEVYKNYENDYIKKFKKPEISIILDCKKINDDVLESILDLAGPYFELFLRKNVKINPKYNKHPKIKFYSNKNKINTAGNYLLYLDCSINYNEEFLSDIYKVAKQNPQNSIIRCKGNRKIFLLRKENLKNKNKLKKVSFEDKTKIRKLFYKEKYGNKRIIHIFGIKITYKKVTPPLQRCSNSLIEFYLIDAFEIYHYLPIYKELIQRGINAKIIAEPCSINTSSSWFDYKNAIKILKKNKIKYCTLANSNAKIAITTQRAELLSKYKNKKAHLSYGYGLNKGNFNLSEDTSKDFDFRLVHGDFQKKVVEPYNPTCHNYSVGYPKHDEFFKFYKINKEEIKKKLKIETLKPILVYFPTWHENTIQKFASDIQKLKDDFFIVTKAHHCTFRLPDKKNDLDTLYKISDIVLEGNSSFEEAAILADIAICEARSGSCLEVAYLNRKIPVVPISAHEDIKNNYYEDIYKFGDVVNKPENLYDTIKNIKKQDFDISYYYGPNDGNSTNRAVDVIIKELTDTP